MNIASLRKRADIEAYLIDPNVAKSRNPGGDGHFAFCIDVKLRSLDFSFDGLLERYRESYGFVPDEAPVEWRAKYVEIFGSEDMGDEMGNGDEANNVYENAVESAMRNVEDDEHMAFDGTTIKAKIGFRGRSNGWMVIAEFEGIDMDGDAETIVKSLNYSELRRLYKLVRTLEELWKDKGPEKEVEYQAAMIVFDRIQTACNADKPKQCPGHDANTDCEIDPQNPCEACNEAEDSQGLA